MASKLVGHDDEAGSVSHPANYIKCAKYTAVATGTCSLFYIRCASAGHVKVAIYADSAGEPGARIAVHQTSFTVAAGWNEIGLDASCSIVSGTDYWLAFNSDATIVREKAETRQGRYKAVAFANDLPDPAGTGFTTDTTNSMICAGWGGLSLTKALVDSIAIVDSHAANVGVIKSDTITIADVVAFLKTISLSLSDNITITDSFSKVSEFKRSISDLVALTDTLTRAVEFNRSIADSIAIADVISKEFRLPRGEAIAIADALVKAVGLNKFDTVSIADLFAKVSAFAPALADTVSINDVISKAVGVVKADIIAITEGLQRIIGSANVSVDDTVGTDFFRLSKFTAEASEDVVQIRIYSEGSFNVKVAMYEDNAGEPGDLMNAVNVAQAVVTGWNLIAFPATAVVLGTDYWLAFNSG